MVNIFDKILGSAGALFSKKENSVIGVDIGSSFLKIVQLKKKNGKAVLETYGELALGPYAGLEVGQATSLPMEKIAEALNDLIKESNITTKNAALSLPLGASLLSIMEMPAIDNRQLAKMIPIEARKYIPIPVSEVSLDWWVVPKMAGEDEEESAAKDENAKEKIGRIDVMVVAILNEVIKKYTDIIKTVGFINTFFELEVFSTSRATFGNHTSPVMVLDIGAGSSKIAIVEYGVIKNQHIINKGSQDITAAIATSLNVDTKKAEDLKREVGLTGTGNENDIGEKVSEVARFSLDYILSEASRVLLNYQRKNGKTIGSVILSGGGAMIKGLYPLAEEKLETEVLFADPFAKVESPAFLEPVLKDAGPEFAVSVGLALRKLQEFE